MTKYSALVKDGKREVIIKNEEYRTKGEFVKELRANGYKVNPKKVKPSDVFEFVMWRTDREPSDWETKKVPHWARVFPMNLEQYLRKEQSKNMILAPWDVRRTNPFTRRGE